MRCAGGHVIDVVVTQSGYAGAKVPLIVEDEGRTISSQDITLPADGESQTVKVRLKAGDAGARSFRFPSRVSPPARPGAGADARRAGELPRHGGRGGTGPLPG